MTQTSRVTQAGTLALDQSVAAGRVTQSGILALCKPSPAAHLTQAVTLVLAHEFVGACITQAAVLALVVETPAMTQRAQLWTLTRTDGAEFCYTTHDEAQEWRGRLYKPCDSLQASASSGGLISGGVGDVQVKGILSDAAITARDLAGGVFDGATVEVWVVQWGDDEQGFIPYRLTKGVLGKISQGEQSFTAEMLTPAARLQQRPLLQQHTPACRWRLGNGRCPVDLDALRVISFVTAASIDAVRMARYRMFYDEARGEADGYFADGDLTWTTGDNAGLGSEVKTNDGKWFTLWSPMPNEIQPTDEYQITPGCNKTRTDHTTKFGLNMVDFGGFPDIPGNDALVETPNAKS